MTDNWGATATQDVTVTITGTNDGPDAVDDVLGGALRVAVIGTASSALGEAAAQLNDSSAFSFAADAVPMSAHFTAAEWTAALAGYDVVVVGSSGFFDAPQFDSSHLFPALRSFVDSGGGVVTTGWFTYDMNNMYNIGAATAADADYVSPAARGFYTWAQLGDTITVLDSTHPITEGVGSYVVNTVHHEQTTAIDASATRLAAGPDFLGFGNTSAIAYDEVGAGLTAYVGGLYMANPGGYGTGPLRSGVLDQILEQAVAWTGHGGGASTDEDHALTIASATLLANDTDVDTIDTRSIVSVSSTSALGASVSLDAFGNVVYDPTQALQYLSEGQTANDTFTYTISDNHGAQTPRR